MGCGFLFGLVAFYLTESFCVIALFFISQKIFSYGGGGTYRCADPGLIFLTIY